MNLEEITDILMELTILPFFPAEPAARVALVRMVGKMAHDEGQVRRLVNVITANYEKWEGPGEVRRVFCQMYKPADGVEAGCPLAFPEGMTTAQLHPGRKPEAAQLESKRVFQLGPGEQLTKDPEMLELVHETVAHINKLPQVKAEPVRADETEYAALQRISRESRPVPVVVSTDPLAKVKPATSVDIEVLKREQNKNRKESTEYAVEA